MTITYITAINDKSLLSAGSFSQNRHTLLVLAIFAKQKILAELTAVSEIYIWVFLSFTRCLHLRIFRLFWHITENRAKIKVLATYICSLQQVWKDKSSQAGGWQYISNICRSYIADILAIYQQYICSYKQFGEIHHQMR